MQFYSQENLNFLLYEVFDIDRLSNFELFKEHNRESYDLVLDACKSLSEKKLRPILKEMDEQEPQFKDGRIKVHPQMRDLMKLFGEGGWINAPLSYQEGGQQLPYMIFNATMFIMGAANYSATAFPFLTAGASNLIRSFGSDQQKDDYLQNMYNGIWQGTMALTEPEAGSSLGDLTTLAQATDEDYYMIKGQKVFISCGDHDACDNIVHLMLARIEGAPKGTKGISLFIVPRMRADENGGLVFNDVKTGGIFHKMGYKGAPITHLIMGEDSDCRGYLVGEANQGLTYMFQMMNEARIAVGFNATSIASAAYYAALEYCRERKQGRKIGNRSVDQSLIIEHADVKRLLLFQRSIVEGSLSLLMECCYYADLCRVTSSEEKEQYEALLDLLTPVAKTYPSEMGCLSTSAAIQCLGGYGYTNEYLPQHFYREARIHPIHEGTTAIHGMDLLGRKIIKDQGKGLRLLLAQIQITLNAAKKKEQLKESVQKLEAYIEQLSGLTMELGMLGMQGKLEEMMADASLYLEAFGILVIAWQWLKQAVHCVGKQEDFYRGKYLTFQYYFKYELPKIDALFSTLKAQSGITVQMKNNYFQ